MTLRDKILAARDTKPEPVPVPEWDCTVYVRSLTAAEREAVEQDKSNVRFREKLLAMVVCDEDGKPVFTRGDIDALAEKAAGPIVRLVEIAWKKSGIGEAAVEDAKKN
jgi:hypothetical protein